jgi:hypothetical protein
MCCVNFCYKENQSLFVLFHGLIDWRKKLAFLKPFIVHPSDHRMPSKLFVAMYSGSLLIRLSRGSKSHRNGLILGEVEDPWESLALCLEVGISAFHD